MTELIQLTVIIFNFNEECLATLKLAEYVKPAQQLSLEGYYHFYINTNKLQWDK